MAIRLVAQALDAQQAIEAATAHLQPITTDNLIAHQQSCELARFKAKVHLAAKNAYRNHQVFLDDEYFPYDALPESSKRHWETLVLESANIIWGKR